MTSRQEPGADPTQPDPAATSVSSISHAEFSTMDTAPFPVIVPDDRSAAPGPYVVDVRAPLFPEWPE